MQYGTCIIQKAEIKKKEDIKFYTINENRIYYKIVNEKNKLKFNVANFIEINTIINVLNGKNLKKKELHISKIIIIMQL